MLTEPVCNLPAIAEACDQFVFEDYGFQSYTRATGTDRMEQVADTMRLMRLPTPPTPSCLR